MALTRAVTLRIPFLVLRFARLGVPTELRDELYARWESELWYILAPAKKGWLARLLFVRFIAGMIYAVPIALFGARAQSKLTAPSGSEAPAGDATTSREGQRAKRRVGISPISFVLYAMFTMVLVVLGVAVLMVLMVFKVSLSGPVIIAVTAAVCSIPTVVLSVMTYLGRDRN